MVSSASAVASASLSWNWVDTLRSFLPKIRANRIATGRMRATVRVSWGLVMISSATPPTSVTLWATALAREVDIVVWTTATSLVSLEVISPVLRVSKKPTGSVIRCL